METTPTITIDLHSPDTKNTYEAYTLVADGHPRWKTLFPRQQHVVPKLFLAVEQWFVEFYEQKRDRYWSCTPDGTHLEENPTPLDDTQFASIGPQKQREVRIEIKYAPEHVAKVLVYASNRNLGPTVLYAAWDPEMRQYALVTKYNPFPAETAINNMLLTLKSEQIYLRDELQLYARDTHEDNLFCNADQMIEVPIYFLFSTERQRWYADTRPKARNKLIKTVPKRL